MNFETNNPSIIEKEPSSLVERADGIKNKFNNICQRVAEKPWFNEVSKAFQEQVDFITSTAGKVKESKPEWENLRSKKSLLLMLKLVGTFTTIGVLAESGFSQDAPADSTETEEDDLAKYLREAREMNELNKQLRE